MAVSGLDCCHERMHGVAGVWGSQEVSGIHSVFVGVGCWRMRHFGLCECLVHRDPTVRGVVLLSLGLSMVGCLLCPFETVELGR